MLRLRASRLLIWPLKDICHQRSLLFCHAPQRAQGGAPQPKVACHLYQRRALQIGADTNGVIVVFLFLLLLRLLPPPFPQLQFSGEDVGEERRGDFVALPLFYFRLCVRVCSLGIILSAERKEPPPAYMSDIQGGGGWGGDKRARRKSATHSLCFSPF